MSVNSVCITRVEVSYIYCYSLLLVMACMIMSLLLFWHEHYLWVARWLVRPPFDLQILPHVSHTKPVLLLDAVTEKVVCMLGLQFLLLNLNKVASGRCWRHSLALMSIFSAIATGFPLSPSSSSLSSPPSSSSPLSSSGGQSSLLSVSLNRPLLKLFASSCILRGSCTEQIEQVMQLDIEYPWSVHCVDCVRQVLWKLWPQFRRWTGTFSSAVQCSLSQANRGSGSWPVQAYPKGRLLWSTVASREGR